MTLLKNIVPKHRFLSGSPSLLERILLSWRYMEEGEAPLFIYTNAPEKDVIHHPINAFRIRDKAKELKIPSGIVGGGRNKLPLPKDGTLG